MTSRLLAVFAAASVAFAPLTVSAHGSEEPEHGGVVQMSGEIKVEFVLRKGAIDVYISEEDVPLDPADFNAELIIVASDGVRTKRPLVAQSGNRLTSTGARPAAGSRVVVSLVAKSNQMKSFAAFRMK